jgi:type III secretion protein HrpB1
MSTNQPGQSGTASLVRTLVEAIENDRLDEARTLLAQLYEINPAAREVLVFPTLIAIRSGQALDALRHINSLPEGRCDELKALCLYAIGDPTWHRYAEEKADDPNPLVREAMLQLLGRSSAEQTSTASA